VADRLYAVWSRLGVVDYGRFRNAFGPLFASDPPRYAPDLLERALARAIDDAKRDGGYALRTLTPARFVEQVQAWVDSVAPIAAIDPERAYRLGIVGAPKPTDSHDAA